MLRAASLSAVHRPALRSCSAIYVMRSWSANARFPPLEMRQWCSICRQQQAADERHAYALNFEVRARLIGMSFRGLLGG